MKRAAILLVFAGAGCAGYLPRMAAPPGTEPTGFYEDRSRPDLALLEFRLARYFASSERPYETVCAGLGWRQRDDFLRKAVPLSPQVETRLLARFPDLKPFETCVPDNSGYRDRVTGRPAAMFDVHELECETPIRCSAYAGSLANGPHGWSPYWAEWRGEQWRIRRRKLDIIVTGGGPGE